MINPTTGTDELGQPIQTTIFVAVQAVPAEAGVANEHVSAFIMDFGNVTIIEFSKKNSACYVYTNDPADLYLDLSKAGFHWRELKNKSAGNSYPHASGWQGKFRGILARHGIRPE